MDLELEQLHKDLTEILVVFDKFCKEHDIRYSLAFGTLIGAIRHDGIIPWDDDIDIMMTREDYERFRVLATEEFSEAKGNRFVFHDHRNNPNYNLLFGKLFDTAKPFDSARHLEHEKYLWIDIFPFDYAPKSKFLKVMWYNFYLKFLSTGFGSKSYGWKGVFTFQNFKKLLFLPYSRKFIANSYERYWKRNLKRKEKHPEKMITVCVNCHTRRSLKAYYYPIDFFEHYEDHAFQGGQYPIITAYDPFLRDIFHDYMTPPPVEERVRKH